MTYYLDNPEGVHVIILLLPASQENYSGACRDVALSPSLVQSSQQSLVHILKPFFPSWLLNLIEKRMDTSVEMALGGREMREEKAEKTMG